MLNVMTLFKPVAGQSRDECQDHYRVNHGKIACSTRGYGLHMCKYVQNFVIEGEPNSSFSNGWAGLSEDCFYNLQSFWDASSEPDQMVLWDDVQRFVKLDEIILVAAMPCFQFGPNKDGPFKLFRFGNFRADVDPSEARNFWEATYARHMSHDTEIRTIAATYVQDRPQKFPHGFDSASSADAVDEFWFDSPDFVPKFLEAEERVRLAAGYSRFFDVQRETMVLTEAKLLWNVGEAPANGLTRMKV